MEKTEKGSGTQSITFRICKIVYKPVGDGIDGISALAPLDVRGVDNVWKDVERDEVDLVGQPTDAEHHHHDHHHLDDLKAK